MWGGLDLSAISGAVGEALKNASTDLEKGVSSALGIDPSKDVAELSLGPSAPSTHVPLAGELTASAPEASSKKKIVKKVAKPTRAVQEPSDVQSPNPGDPALSAAPKKRIVRVVKPKSATLPSAAIGSATMPGATPGESKHDETPEPSLYKNPLFASSRESIGVEGHQIAPTAPSDTVSVPAAACSGDSMVDRNAPQEGLNAVNANESADSSPDPRGLPEGEATSSSVQPDGAKSNMMDPSIQISPPDIGDARSSLEMPYCTKEAVISSPADRPGGFSSPSTSNAVTESEEKSMPASYPHPSATQSKHSLTPKDAASTSYPLMGAGSSTAAFAPVAPVPALEALHGVGDLPRAALEALAMQLHETAATGRGQLVKDAEQISYLQQVIAQLQVKNEELALRTASISEQDFEEIRGEFEQRLAAAERKVYALTKERDALKKGSEKLSEYSALIKEKDAIIKQVMEEGEVLASKQAELELSMKKLKQQVRGLEEDRNRLQSKLEAEQAEAEGQRRARIKAEREVVTVQEQAKADLEAQRAQAEALLGKAKSEQSEAEERAREAASLGLSRRLKESEGRGEALSDSVAELREALERQRQAADLREEMLKQDIADMERRCHAAELRHQELTAKIPETARPLLRQIEAMQAAADAQADAWAAAEAMLHQRISDAESRAASASERDRLASDRAQTLAARLSGAEGALQAGRDEVRSLEAQLEAALQRCGMAEERARVANHQIELMQERRALMEKQQEEANSAAAEALEAERRVRIAAEADAISIVRESERRVAELESQLAQAQAHHRMSGGASLPTGSGAGRRSSQAGGPTTLADEGGHLQPTLAAPGYRWVLVKEGEQPQSQSQSQHPEAERRRSAGGAANSAFHQTPQHPSRADEVTAPLDLLPQLGRSNSVAGSGGGPLMAAGAEALRMELRMKATEISALEARVKELELTRDQLAEELVSSTHKSEKASDALAAAAALSKEVELSQQRYTAAVELLGERDEALEELRADLMDVKLLYRDQIEYLVKQLALDGGGKGNPVSDAVA